MSGEQVRTSRIVGPDVREIPERAPIIWNAQWLLVQRSSMQFSGCAPLNPNNQYCASLRCPARQRQQGGIGCMPLCRADVVALFCRPLSRITAPSEMLPQCGECWRE